MKKLSWEAFRRGRKFVMKRGRRLEQALFRQRFKGGSVNKVLEELREYQNKDGGFGRALEPDLRTPSSSALATGIGLRIMRQLGCTAEETMVHEAISYLLTRYDKQSRT